MSENARSTEHDEDEIPIPHIFPQSSLHYSFDWCLSGTDGLDASLPMGTKVTSLAAFDPLMDSSCFISGLSCHCAGLDVSLSMISCVHGSTGRPPPAITFHSMVVIFILPMVIFYLQNILLLLCPMRSNSLLLCYWILICIVGLHYGTLIGLQHSLTRMKSKGNNMEIL